MLDTMPSAGVHGRSFFSQGYQGSTLFSLINCHRCAESSQRSRPSSAQASFMHRYGFKIELLIKYRPSPTLTVVNIWFKSEGLMIEGNLLLKAARNRVQRRRAAHQHCRRLGLGGVVQRAITAECCDAVQRRASAGSDRHTFSGLGQLLSPSWAAPRQSHGRWHCAEHNGQVLNSSQAASMHLTAPEAWQRRTTTSPAAESPRSDAAITGVHSRRISFKAIEGGAQGLHDRVPSPQYAVTQAPPQQPSEGSLGFQRLSNLDL